MDNIVFWHENYNSNHQQCDSTGKIKEKYATDMLVVATGCADWQYLQVECPLCHGTGTVPKKLKPKMVQYGWTEAELC